MVFELSDGARVTDRLRRVLVAARGAGLRVFFIRYMTLPTELAAEIAEPLGCSASGVRTSRQARRTPS